MKISVIMPMYNAKGTVIHSINSILNQSYSDLEVLVVDDCSKDDSYEFCKEHFKDDVRVKVLKQEINAGPAAARNRGIREATGDYITFLDSDDGMIAGALEKFAAAAKEYDADIIHTVGYYIPVAVPTPDDIMSVPKDRLLKYVADVSAPAENTVLTSDLGERISAVIEGRCKGNVWGKLFKASFLKDNHIEFAHLKMSEDTIFALECLLKSKIYVQIPECFIIYRMFGDSLSRGKKTPAFFAKILDSTLGGNAIIQEKLSEIPYLKDHPEQIRRVLTYASEAMENVYVRPAYRIVGREEIEKDEETDLIWNKYFGGNADLIKKAFYDAHDHYPPVQDYFSEGDFVGQCEEALKAQNAREQ